MDEPAGDPFGGESQRVREDVMGGQVLTLSQLWGLLHAGAEAVAAETGSQPAAQLAWRPAPEEWCANEIIGHLIEAEQRGFAGRIRQILSEDAPVAIGWDPPAVAAQRRDHERDGRALVGEFIALREQSLRLVARLEDRDLPRAVQHPLVGPLTISDLLHEWLYHDREHIKQLLENTRLAVWPGMGNARRFSQPEF